MALRRTSKSALQSIRMSVTATEMLEAGRNAPGKNLEDVGDEGVQDMTMLGTESIEAVENNKLCVVVRFPLNQADIARGGS